MFKISTILLIFLGILVGYLTTQLSFSAGQFEASSISSGDTAWILIATALVMLMTPAVGFFYGGMVKSKNVVSVIKHSLVILSLVSLQWVIIGYSLVFGNDMGGLIGNLNFIGLKGVGFAPNADYAATIPQLAFMIYQGMFAIITPALIIGAFVGRIRFKALVVFVLAWTTLIYDPVAHWVWGTGGWLRNLGALDFAGGTVVHVTAGFSALAAAIIIGRRKEVSRHVVANNVPTVLLGASLLWFGWFGFNAGSALAASVLAVNAFVVTNIAAATSALVWMVMSWVQHKKPSALATATGAVCGLVAITPASGFVSAMSAIAIGIFAGLVTYLSLSFRVTYTKIDDTLDVWAAHGMGGVTGAVLTGIFAEKAINTGASNGLLFGNPQQVLMQLLAVLIVATYSFFGTIVILKIVKVITNLRVSLSEEIKGLDLAVHGEAGYRF